MMKKLIIPVVFFLVAAMILNISDSDYKTRTKEKIVELVIEKCQKEDSGSISSFITAAIAEPLINELIEIKIHNYILFSTASMVIPNEKYDEIIGISVFGKTLFFTNDIYKSELERPKEISLKGTYVSDTNPFYKSLTFKGKSTVTIKDRIFGISQTSEYIKDEDYIRIKTDKSDLLLRIATSDSLVGEGFAKGCFVRKSKQGI